VNIERQKDIEHFPFIDLFAEIGGFHSAATQLAGKCAFASEIDTQAQKAYLANDNIRPWGDMTQALSLSHTKARHAVRRFSVPAFQHQGQKTGLCGRPGYFAFESLFAISKKMKKRPWFFGLLKDRKQAY